MNVIAAAPETETPAVAGDLGLSFTDDEPTVVIDVIPITVKSSRSLRVLPRLTRAVTDLLCRAAGVVVRAVTRTYVAIRHRTRRAARAHLVYKPRHAARRTWYARQRSTSQYNAACRQRAKEDELCHRYPPEFISLLETFIETLRREEDILHPTRSPGRHFICS